MRLLRSAVLYTAFAFAANAATAMPDLAPLLQGDMRKLVPADAPGAPVEGALVDAADAPVDLSAHRGKWLLVNFWATWCAPCRAEMPMLDRLQAEFGGDRFAVLPVATGRNPLPAIHDFYVDEGLTALPILRDPKQQFARQMAVLGLPVTVLIDPEGREVARMQGEAHWDGPEAKALVAALIAGE
ncbi:TlpA family protein disulfide reductase [Frigidibacter oleivorans]|uniref:TlpA family protein disulfide reductase n=1 Tax=Frigidibacter oleivorans TaxID=2487129 RepID=UPI000F8DA405|nr:TlpA disulfide reductase family protein [Frigidibacter oleivorans]